MTRPTAPACSPDCPPSAPELLGDGLLGDGQLGDGDAEEAGAARLVVEPGMVPVRVHATLAGGVAHAVPWGLALDGLLASQLWAVVKQTRYTDDVDQHDRSRPDTVPDDLPLPLARCTGDGDTLWHWAATCSYAHNRPDGIPPEIHYWTGRLDSRASEHVAERLPASISERQGRYRSRHMPVLVTACTALTWTAVGHLDQVRDLLITIAAIGKKRSHGEGHVLSWSVTAAPDLDPWQAAHLHPDGTLARPCPPDCLAGPAWQGQAPAHAPVGRAGIRPPVMHPARQARLLLPVGLA